MKEMDIERDIIINSYYVIDYFNQNGESITNLKLQKLMYFMEGLYMVLTDEDYLFEQEFFAWNLGPVCKELYDYYKECGNENIELTEEKRKKIINFPNINKVFVEVLFKVFSGWSAYELVELTHEQGSPWYHIKNNIEEESNQIVYKKETKIWLREKIKV